MGDCGGDESGTGGDERGAGTTAAVLEPMMDL